MRRNLKKRAGVRLSDVLATTLPPAGDATVTSCTNCASSVRPGDAYVAPDADAVTVAKLAEQAIEAGAAALVVNQFLPVAGVPQFVVEDTHLAFGELCHALVGNPCGEIHLTAVAGGLGKTSVTRLLNSINRVAARPCSSLPEGVNGGKSSPAAVARWLARSAAGGATHAIAEAPAASAADRRFDGTRFDVLLLNNFAGIEPAANESTESLRRGVRSPLRYLSDDGVLVVNADDADCCRVLSTWGGEALTFGFGDAADVRGTVLQRHSAGQVLLVQHGVESAAVETSTIGDAHASNCLAAVATVLTSGVSLTAAAAGVERTTPAPQVLQPVVCGQQFPVYMDSATKSDAVASAAASVAKVTQRRLLTVIAGDQPPSVSALTAARAASDLVIVAGGKEQLERLRDVRVVDEPFAGAALAIALAEPGDSVLLLGDSRGADSPNLDEQVVRELLQLRVENEPTAAAAA